MRNAHKDMRLKKDFTVEFSEPLSAALEIREFAVSDYDYMVLCSSWEGYVDGKTAGQIEAILLGPAQQEHP